MLPQGQSGRPNKARLLEEVALLLSWLEPALGAMTEKEQQFVESMLLKQEEFGDALVVSSKQLFWLRDLAERYS